MNKSIAAFMLAATALLATGNTADAQVFRRGPRVFTGPGGPVTLTPGYGAPVSAASSSSAVPGYTPPYSYYAAPAGMPARIYEGPSAFPFYGRPYGHVNDSWSWPAMRAGGYNELLSRYYYPPLG